MLSYRTIGCPCCGESIELPIDASAGSQQYIEDCQVCCRPINVVVVVDGSGDTSVSVSAENEA